MTDKCAIWHSHPLINPLTNRKIKKNGPTYKNLLQECGPPPSSSRRRSPSRNRRSPSPARVRRSPSPQRNRQPSSARRVDQGPSRSLLDRQVEIYCGNNARDEGLVQGTKVLGSRYQCLKKGIGRGLNEPILHYTDEYEPIEHVKLYCGNNPTLPPDKDRFGTRDECLRKGFAVGQRQKYTRDGGIQRGPVISQEHGWYKVYLPSNLGPVSIRDLER